MAPNQQNKEIQNLQFLGLTLNQARVYAALAKFENATAKNLSDETGLAACDVYRVIPELQTLSLLDIIVTRPKTYRAARPEEAIKTLLGQKQKEIEEMRAKAKELVAEMSSKKNPEHRDLTEIALIPPGERTIQFGMSKLLNTIRQLDIIQTNPAFYRFTETSATALKRLLNRNVKVRFILENKMAIEKPDKDLAEILQNPNFKFRFAKTKINACILLHDETDAFISTSTDTLHTPSCWSSNPCLISVVKGFFEDEWRKASELRK